MFLSFFSSEFQSLCCTCKFTFHNSDFFLRIASLCCTCKFTSCTSDSFSKFQAYILPFCFSQNSEFISCKSDFFLRTRSLYCNCKLTFHNFYFFPLRNLSLHFAIWSVFQKCKLVCCNCKFTFREAIGPVC